MLKPVRLIASLFVGLAMIIAAVVVADSSTASPAARHNATAPRHVATAPAARSHVAAASKPKKPKKPCGRKHYSKCPPKKHSGVTKHKVRRGRSETVNIKNYPAHTKVVVHLAGKHYYKKIRVTRIGKHRDSRITFKMPKNLKPGKYWVYVRIGNSTHAYRVTVTK